MKIEKKPSTHPPKESSTATSQAKPSAATSKTSDTSKASDTSKTSDTAKASDTAKGQLSDKSDAFHNEHFSTGRKIKRDLFAGSSSATEAERIPDGIPDAAAMMNPRGSGLSERSPLMMEATAHRSEPLAHNATRLSIPLPDIPGVATASMSVGAFGDPDPIPNGKSPGYWDARLSDPTQNPPVMAHFEPAEVPPGATYLHADSVRYENDQESGGRHHIYVKAPEGVDVYALDARGEKIPFNEKYEDFDRDGQPERYFEMPMWGGNHYKVFAEGRPGTPYEGMVSDKIADLKMPANHHVNYHIDFVSAQSAQTNVPTTNAPTRSMPSVGLLDIPTTYQPPQTAPHAPTSNTNTNAASDLVQLAQDKGLRTNQDLINHFYREGGDTWDGAVAAATPYGVDLKKLAANRTAPIDLSAHATSPTSPQTPTAPSLEQMVQQTYRDVLQREADPSGLQHWKNIAQDLRDMGKTDPEIKQFLQEKFTQSQEYQMRFGDAPPPAPVQPQPTAPTAPVQPQTTAPIAPSDPTSRTRDGQLLNAQGQVENFIGANYTDLGYNAIQDPASPAFRNAVAEDLARLKSQGVETVRVWAAPPNVYPDDDTGRMATRIDVIAQEAAKVGMNITVDLTDSFGDKSVHNYQHGDIARQLDQRIPGVIGPNAHHPNIDWSIGNEIGDPHNPLAFADWYVSQAERIREHAGPDQRIISELTPGAVGHPDHGWPQAREAMKKIVEASDIVGVHFYPVGAPGQLSGPRPDGTWPAADWDSVQTWAALAKDANKPLVIGEFSIPRDAQPVSQDEYIHQTNAWLQELHNLGADQVRFWQFMKDEVGHFDPAAVDLIDHTHGHKGDTQALLDSLHHNGWIGKKPLP